MEASILSKILEAYKSQSSRDMIYDKFVSHATLDEGMKAHPANVSGRAMLDTMPAEVCLMIADRLEPLSYMCLKLSCKRMDQTLVKSLRVIAQNDAAGFYSNLERVGKEVRASKRSHALDLVAAVQLQLEDHLARDGKALQALVCTICGKVLKLDKYIDCVRSCYLIE